MALIVFCFVLGLCLVRLNIFAVLIASVILVAGTFLVDMIRDAPLTHSLLASVVEAVFLPVGYLAGQMLRPSRK